MTSNESLRDPPGRNRPRARQPAGLEEPILAELFSVERLEQHAETLAAAQAVTDAPRRGHAVGPRIAENGRVLVDAYRVLARAIKDERAITPAAEWLVDNFPIVDEQLREIRDDLPPDYYRELPKLAAGHLAGYPRVLGLAWAYIAHTDSRFDPESLTPDGAGLPGGGPADDRRAVGDRDQPADPPRREPSPPRGTDRGQPGSAAEGRRDRRQPARPRQGQPGGRGGVPATAVAHRTADGGPGPALPAPARPGPRRHPRPALAGGAPRGRGDDSRGDGPPRAPAPGDDERDGPQRHHEHAPHLVVRLGAVRREREPGRRRPERTKSVPGDGLRDARSLPARRRGAGPGLRPHRGRGRPGGRGDGGDAAAAGRRRYRHVSKSWPGVRA